MVPTPNTVAIIRRVVDALDFATLARLYCDHGGEAFWADRRGPVVEDGLHWARELSRRVAPGGASLYVGAGVAEIPAMLVEALDLGRSVTACNLRPSECAVLNDAFARHALPLQVRAGDARAIAGTFDHIALVSVLCDPETFPTISDVTYGRVHPLHLDPARFAAERQAVCDLVATVCGRLRLPAWLTTTVEELPWVLAWAEQHGVRAVADDTLVATAVVGDPIGFVQLVAAGGS